MDVPNVLARRPVGQKLAEKLRAVNRSVRPAVDHRQMKYWEVIADRLSENGWSWGCSSQIDSTGRTIFTADAHRDDGKRFIVHADEKLTAFLELKSAIAGLPELS